MPNTNNLAKLGSFFAKCRINLLKLPPKSFGIDVDNDFSPEYEILEGKKQVVDRLKKAAKEAEIVYLAPDPDREGEAIAWHIASILPKGTKYKRITFNEITKEAVKAALKNPRDIDENLVNAQQTRRFLDRMVGYKISPILHRKIGRAGKDGGSLSAGRVQSVALKLVVDREKEIDAFISVEYWNLGALLASEGKKKQFESYLFSVDGKKVAKESNEGKDLYLIPNKESADQLVEKLKRSSFKVAKVEKKEKKRNPVPPFITSTLQQEAARHYGFSASRTMSTAQGLYEGVDLGQDGSEGLITYMRTDSVRVSLEAQSSARAHISLSYGDQFLPEKAPVYASKKNVQDAHEAIRPTNFEHTPDLIKSRLTSDQYKLYLLIWRRFLASQMNAAIYDTATMDIETNQGLDLRTTGSIIKYQGFLVVYEEKEDNQEESKEEEKTLPDLKVGEILDLIEPTSTQSFTKPPPRYTEASLVKELEKSGIGRPSTYATIMQKIQGRSYTEKEKNTLKATELGKIICQMLEENFPKIMDIKFTAEMEEDLDRIAEEQVEWKAFLKKFWDDFYPTVERASKNAVVPKVETDLICPECKKGKLQKIWSKNKYFYGCTDYPECKYTGPLEEDTINKEEYMEGFDWDQKCPKCGGEMKTRKSRFGFFLGCAKYPECKTIINIPKRGEMALQDLPKCPAIGCDGQITQRRSRFGKVFFSCSTFPECDVIANSLEELEQKYPDHQKTAYVSKNPKKNTVAKKTATEKKTTTKKTTAKKTITKKKTTSKKETKPSLQYKLSKELSEIVGVEELSRQQVTKSLWDYIKKHKLQDEKNKRLIVPDAKLKKLFGSPDPVDMMKLAGFISKHLIKND